MIDRDALAEELGFLREEIDLLMVLFEKNARQSLSNMHEAIGRNDLEGVAEAAHAIKGIAGNLRMESVYTLASEMNHKAKEGEERDYWADYQQLHALVEAQL